MFVSRHFNDIKFAGIEHFSCAMRCQICQFTKRFGNFFLNLNFTNGRKVFALHNFVATL